MRVCVSVCLWTATAKISHFDVLECLREEWMSVSHPPKRNTTKFLRQDGDDSRKIVPMSVFVHKLLFS
jgi:hypothetical protein